MSEKGAETRERILDRAFRLASRDGLEGLTLGTLAGELGLSKSGLYAHFGSKEELELEVLEEAVARFQANVLTPALKAPPGLPRLRRLFEQWMAWISDPALPGGCLFFAAATELDDRDGRPRDYLQATQRDLRAALAKAARLAVEEGHFRADLDCEQLAFELNGIALGYHHARRLLRDERAEARARTAFQRLLAAASIA